MKEIPLPIACSLQPAELHARREDWSDVIRRGLADRSPTPNGVRLRFEPSAGVERDLERLVELERDCCAFARWELSRADAGLVLDVTAEGEGAKAARELFSEVGASAQPSL